MYEQAHRSLSNRFLLEGGGFSVLHRFRVTKTSHPFILSLLPVINSWRCGQYEGTEGKSRNVELREVTEKEDVITR